MSEFLQLKFKYDTQIINNNWKLLNGSHMLCAFDTLNIFVPYLAYDMQLKSWTMRV